MSFPIFQFRGPLCIIQCRSTIQHTSHTIILEIWPRENVMPIKMLQCLAVADATMCSGDEQDHASQTRMRTVVKSTTLQAGKLFPRMCKTSPKVSGKRYRSCLRSRRSIYVLAVHVMPRKSRYCA